MNTTYFRITYRDNATIQVDTKRGTIRISYSRPRPDDDQRWAAVLTTDQCDRLESLGARRQTDYYRLPLDQAAAVFALAAEAWGEPIDNSGSYPIPGMAPAVETDTDGRREDAPAAENDPTQAAARIIFDHGDTLYQALRSHIAYQTREATTGPLDLVTVLEDNEGLHELADYILDVQARLPEPELWSVLTVAEYIGASTEASARRTLGRWGVKPKYRAPGRGGQNLYSPAEVKAAKAKRPGRGARTDLQPDFPVRGVVVYEDEGAPVEWTKTMKVTTYTDDSKEEVAAAFREEMGDYPIKRVSLIPLISE